MNFKLWLEKNEQIFNEDFKTQREKFIQQGYEANIVDYYLNQFKTIKDKKYKQINDPIPGLETITNRIDIDAYKDFKQLEALVDYVKGKTDVAGKTNYKDIKVDAKPIFEDDTMVIYYADSPHACVTYKGSVPYSWCISRSDVSNMYNTYRYKEHEPAFYFVKNKERTKNEFNLLNLLRNAATLSFKDKYHFFVIQVPKNANIQDKESKQYIVTSAQNDGDTQMSWKEIVKIEPQLANKQNLFKPVGLTEKERQLYDRFKGGISDEAFAKLPYDEKDTYLNIYVRMNRGLTDEQFSSLPYDLKNKYIGFGVALTPEQLKMIDGKLYKRYEEVTKTLIEKTFGTDDFKLSRTQIDVFTKNINDYDLNKLSDDNVTNFLYSATNPDEMAKLIIQNKKDLTNNNVTNFLYYVTNKDEMAKLIIQNKKDLTNNNVSYLLYFAKNKDEMANLIIQNKKDLSDDDVYNLLHSVTNKDKIAKLLGSENIKKLSHNNVYRLLRTATNPDEMAKLIIQNKKDLTNNNVSNLLRYAKNKYEIAKLLGSENINKLSDDNFYDLLRSVTNPDEMRSILQKYGRFP